MADDGDEIKRRRDQTPPDFELDPRVKRPDRDGEPYLDLQNGRKLWPLFHSLCGAICLYSKVPIRSGQRVPDASLLMLADGVTPFWAGSYLVGRARPPAPDCPACGESVNKRLRTKPLEN